MLQQIKFVCQINEAQKGDKGDTARILRRLAEALQLNGEFVEANELEDEVGSIRKKLQGPSFDVMGDTEESYNTLLWFRVA